MKETGITRAVDQIGRVVVPKEIRDTLDIKREDSVEIFTEGKDIILRKYQPGCYICGSMDDVIEFGNGKICRKCIEKIKKL